MDDNWAVMTSQRKRILALLGPLVLYPGAVARADRDVVFSAQYYRWSDEYYRDLDGGKPQRTLDDVGPYHLYRTRPDGNGRRQITFGPNDDLIPKWSPNGKMIAFIRAL